MAETKEAKKDNEGTDDNSGPPPQPRSEPTQTSGTAVHLESELARFTASALQLFKVVGIIITAVGIITTAAVIFISVLLPILFSQISGRISDNNRIMISNHKEHTTQLSNNTDSVVDLRNYIDDRFSRTEGRLVRIETYLTLPVPFTSVSPVCLTEFGISMLEKSGMEELLQKYKSELIELAMDKDPNSPYDAQKVAKEIIDNYNWLDEADPIESYMYNHPVGMMFDIWEIAAIRFRDMVLEYLRMSIPTGIHEKQYAPTEEKTTSPP